MACGQEHDGKRRLPHPEDRRTLAPNGVEHRDEPIRPSLHRRTVLNRHRIRATHPEQVGHEQAAERRQPTQVAGDSGLVPQQVDRERAGRDEEEIRTAITDDLIREVSIAVSRVDGLRDGRHATSMPLGPDLHSAAKRQPVIEATVPSAFVRRWRHGDSG